jgi:DNA-directed RNA polymerase specialized sigma subunit
LILFNFDDINLSLMSELGNSLPEIHELPKPQPKTDGRFAPSTIAIEAILRLREHGLSSASALLEQTPGSQETNSALPAEIIAPEETQMNGIGPELETEPPIIEEAIDHSKPLREGLELTDGQMRLIDRHHRLVKVVIGQAVHQGLVPEERNHVLGDAYMGLIKAVQAHDPPRLDLKSDKAQGYISEVIVKEVKLGIQARETQRQLEETTQPVDDEAVVDPSGIITFGDVIVGLNLDEMNPVLTRKIYTMSINYEPKERETLLRNLYLHQNDAEIATALGVSEEAVERLLKSAFKSLAIQLGIANETT